MLYVRCGDGAVLPVPACARRLIEAHTEYGPDGMCRVRFSGNTMLRVFLYLYSPGETITDTQGAWDSLLELWDAAVYFELGLEHDVVFRLGKFVINERFITPQLTLRVIERWCVTWDSMLVARLRALSPNMAGFPGRYVTLVTPTLSAFTAWLRDNPRLTATEVRQTLDEFVEVCADEAVPALKALSRWVG